MLQDVFLFSGSVLDNITLRNPEISREKVVEAAKLIDMDAFINRLPGGYDYNVMERGATLSLGQREVVYFNCWIDISVRIYRKDVFLMVFFRIKAKFWDIMTG